VVIIIMCKRFWIVTWRHFFVLTDVSGQLFALSSG
jgi:hypothetical protein